MANPTHACNAMQDDMLETQKLLVLAVAGVYACFLSHKNSRSFRGKNNFKFDHIYIYNKKKGTNLTWFE